MNEKRGGAMEMRSRLGANNVGGVTVVWSGLGAKTTLVERQRCMARLDADDVWSDERCLVIERWCIQSNERWINELRDDALMRRSFWCSLMFRSDEMITIKRRDDMWIIESERRERKAWEESEREKREWGRRGQGLHLGFREAGPFFCCGFFIKLQQ